MFSLLDAMISSVCPVLQCVLVKTKFAYAYNQDFPYRIHQILECEFFLLEAMVSLHIVAS